MQQKAIENEIEKFHGSHSSARTDQQFNENSMR